jgi:hypothetical protein
MSVINTTVEVGPDRRIQLQAPADLPPGTYRVVVQIIEPPAPPGRVDIAANMPKWDPGPWPENLSLRREDMYGDDGR